MWLTIYNFLDLKKNECRYDFLNYVLNKADDIVKPLPIPRNFPKERVKQTILEPVDDFDELQFFQLNESKLIPKNWSQLTTDDAKEEQINIFDFKVPESYPDTSLKEMYANVKDELVNKVENFINPSENVCTVADKIRSTFYSSQNYLRKVSQLLHYELV